MVMILGVGVVSVLVGLATALRPQAWESYRIFSWEFPDRLRWARATGALVTAAGVLMIVLALVVGIW